MKRKRRTRDESLVTAPSGYVEWHEWAKANYKAGHRSRKCVCCGLYIFDNEFHPYGKCT